MHKSIAIVGLIQMGLVAAVGAAAASPDVLLQGPSQPLRLEAVRAGMPAILVFWRSDCIPCRQELRKLPALRREARPLRLLLVDVESAPELRAAGPAVARLLAGPNSFRALDDPARTLTDFGGKPPRLPLSVLLDATGAVRARRVGELGPLLVREWRLQQMGTAPEVRP